MNVKNINTGVEFTACDTSFEFEVLNDEQINEVSGGIVPLGIAASYVGLGLGGFGLGFSVGQAIWGD